MSDSVFQCRLLNLAKPPQAVSTGIGYLDHMLDQFYSHAQVGVSLAPIHYGHHDDNGDNNEHHNRNANLDQSELLMAIGISVGKALRQLLDAELPRATPTSTASTSNCATFFCPLDEALVQCIIQVVASNEGALQVYDVAPYGKYPSPHGRTNIGRLETAALRSFWTGLAVAAGLRLNLVKVRGDNAHHICEASFKAFCRALRNLLDGIHDDDDASNNDHNDVDVDVPQLYAVGSDNAQASLALARTATIHRTTKETSIYVELRLDGGGAAAKVAIDTGVTTLDAWWTQFANAAGVSLTIHCRGDLHIDEHHTAEDIAIAVGQALNMALGDKAGLNRMWWSRHGTVQATVDLSNRPCLTHNLQLERMEYVGPDLSCEMLEHVLDSLTVNARMTVHLVQDPPVGGNDDDDENNALLVDYGAALVTSTAVSLGRALKYCCMVDQRRAGATASSKGTLSA
jgi:imidazoleglycerol-phosphate dehydratase